MDLTEFRNFHTGNFFKAWYILQHYRGARPFIAEITRSVFIAEHQNIKYEKLSSNTINIFGVYQKQ